MQGCAILRVVDALAGEHALDGPRHARFPRECKQAREPLLVEPLARAIEQDALGLGGEPLKSHWICGEEIGDRTPLDVLCRSLEPAPRRGVRPIGASLGAGHCVFALLLGIAGFYLSELSNLFVRIDAH
jgi:hypothetical protein